MKRLCFIIILSLMLSLCGCSERRITKADLVAVTDTEATTRISPKLVRLSSSASEPTVSSDGRADKHLACVIRVKDGQTSTLKINIYDELGRLINTTSGDTSEEYKYDKESRIIKESKYYKGLYQGCSVYTYYSALHVKTEYSADGSVVYGGETYDEFYDNSGRLSRKNINTDKDKQYTSIANEYDKTTGRIVREHFESQTGGAKELKHSYRVDDRGNLVETVTDEASGKTVSETTYLGAKRSEDKVIRYEEYDLEGNIIRGFENQYDERNGINVLESKGVMGINSATGKIKADMYFYSTSEFKIEDGIYEYLGMSPSDFSSLTVHMASSDHDDAVVTYDSRGTVINKVNSKRDDSGRVVEVKETGNKGTLISLITFEYDESGNCTKMTVDDGDDTAEYIFGYITIPDVYCEPFSCTQAEEYIGK